MYQKKDRWTVKQVEYVKKYAGVLSDDEMAGVLGRTPKSVRLKRQRMGIEKQGYAGQFKLKNEKEE